MANPAIGQKSVCYLAAMAQEQATLDTYLYLAQKHGVPPELSELHRDIMVPASEHGWAVYYKDKEIAEVVDLYLAKYQQYLDELPQAKATSSPSVPKQPRKPRKAKQPKAAVPPMATAKPTPKEVEEISVATRLIRRFCGLVNREVELRDLVRLLKTLQQAILKKLVRTTSGFAPELRDIQATLVEIANTAKPGQVRLEVADDKLAVYLSIAGGEQVFESVRLLSRYIRQQGLEPKPDWARKWIKAASRFLASSKGQSDPLHNHILAAIESLEGYLKTGHIRSGQMDLRGLSGLLGLGQAGNLGCTPARPCKPSTGCKAKSRRVKSVSGLGELEAEIALMQRSRTPDTRPAYSFIPAGKQVDGLGSLAELGQPSRPRRKGQPLMTGSDLMAVSYTTHEFSEPIGTLTGKVARGFLAMLHGLPGQGKSTFGLQWAVDAARLSPVLYVSSEEHGSYTLKDKLSRVGGPVAGMEFAASLSDADLSRYRFLFVDSVNHAGMEIEQLRALREKYPLLSIVLVMQSTKEGQFKGSQEWAHEADLVVSVEGGRARTEKNRYAPLASIQVF